MGDAVERGTAFLEGLELVFCVQAAIAQTRRSKQCNHSRQNADSNYASTTSSTRPSANPRACNSSPGSAGRLSAIFGSIA